MTDRAALLALAERVERGERTYALEQDIQSLVRPELAPYMSPPAYLSSLDAAVSLMPELGDVNSARSCQWSMITGLLVDLKAGNNAAIVASALPSSEVTVMLGNRDKIVKEIRTARCSSPARAMTAAALRARAEGA